MSVLKWIFYIYLGGIVLVMAIWIISLWIFLIIGLSAIPRSQIGLAGYKNLAIWILRGIYDFFLNALLWPKNVPLNIYDYCRKGSTQPRE